MSVTQSNLIRKQFLVTESNVKKLNQIASDRGTSATEVVRQAIDAYAPSEAETMEVPELINLVAERLKDAVKATRKANRRVKDAIATLDHVEGAN
jgi:membrane-bound ClpP family serine protease